MLVQAPEHPRHRDEDRPPFPDLPGPVVPHPDQEDADLVPE